LNVSEHTRQPAEKALGLALISLLTLTLLVGISVHGVSASAGTQLNNVQVFIQTTKDEPYSYTVTVYNSSGSQVAYYQSGFAAAAFELPSGTYLFTVQASYGFEYYPCIGCVVTPNSTGNGNGTASPMKSEPRFVRIFTYNGTSTNSTLPTSGNTTGVSPVVIPIFVTQSSNEYGYAVEQISGPTSFTIKTVDASKVPTTQVTIHVAYFNGTAAEGAWVSASVIDDYFYDYNVTSGGQTGANGNVVLTMPTAPLLVTATLNVPIDLPPDNYTVTVGGQKVNVTVTASPSSVYLEGQTMILPPQESGSITLLDQTQQYYLPTPIIPLGVAGATTPSSSGSASENGKSSIGAKLPSFGLGAGQEAAVSKPSFQSEMWILIGAVAAAVVVLAVVLVTRNGNHKQPTVSA